MEIIKEQQDLRYLNWSKIRHSSGTAGTLLKAEETINGIKYYYKLSRYDHQKGIVGHECVNELIVDRLLTAIGVEHLSYSLVNAKVLIDDKELNTYICKSQDYKLKNERKTALEAYYYSNRLPDEAVLDFCIRNGFEDYIYQMFAVDYLILNRDRHGANIEVLKDAKGNIRLAPLFDHGLSLLYATDNIEKLGKSDFLKDIKVMDFVGTGSTLENLGLISKDKLLSLPVNKEEIIQSALKDLDGILPKIFLKKIKQMISERWKFYEVFRNQK